MHFPRESERSVARVTLDAHEGRWLKAALAAADKTAAELAEEIEDYLHIGLRTIERVMQGKRGLKPPEREHIAEVLDVPLSFLERGFARADAAMGQTRALDDETLAQALEELADLQERQDAVLERLLHPGDEPAQRRSGRRSSSG